MLQQSSDHTSARSGHHVFDWVRQFLLAIITGAISGGVIALFRYLVFMGVVRRQQVWAGIATEAGSFVWVFILMAALAALGGIVTRALPVTTGSGVTRVFLALAGEEQLHWWPSLLAKFLASWGILVSGLSLGREGPAVFMGAATGQAVGSWLKADQAQKRQLLAYGTAAAVAAAFGAPLAGVLFVWEEFKYSSLQSFFVPAVGAVVAATKVSAHFLGPQTQLLLTPSPDLPNRAIVIFLLLGLFLGLLGLVYHRSLSYARRLFALVGGHLVWFRPVLAVIPVAVLALLFGSDLLGSGHQLVSRALSGSDGVGVAAVLLMSKLLLTVVCAASDASGGVFVPLLSVGALTGSVFGQIASGFFPSLAFSPRFVVAGMAAAFGGILRLPFTGLILVFELTGSYNYENLLYYLAAALVAYLVRERGEKFLAKKQLEAASET
ncbi:MAG: chloride channel protein [bacterium]